MSNRLAGETSPYLLQHADNPVDWYPWGAEAQERARREGKPLLLSVGYSACHWCHVMAHESFEDPEVAAVDDGERVRAGCVTRVALTEDDLLALTLRLWSGEPKALALRPAASELAEEPALPALLLAEAPDDKPCLILPPRTFNPGRVLCTVTGRPERRYRLLRLLQRGADFERVAFEQQE